MSGVAIGKWRLLLKGFWTNFNVLHKCGPDYNFWEVEYRYVLTIQNVFSLLIHEAVSKLFGVRRQCHDEIRLIHGKKKPVSLRGFIAFPLSSEYSIWQEMRSED